jgi:hypothetical protein
MRSIPVFIVTFIVSMTILVNSYHGYISRASIVVIALGLAVTGLAFGMLAGLWSWIRRHPVAFLGSNFLVAMVILLPMVLISYGGALVLLPFAVEWVGMNLIGLLVTQKILATHKTRTLAN